MDAVTALMPQGVEPHYQKVARNSSYSDIVDTSVNLLQTNNTPLCLHPLPQNTSAGTSDSLEKLITASEIIKRTYALSANVNGSEIVPALHQYTHISSLGNGLRENGPDFIAQWLDKGRVKKHDPFMVIVLSREPLSGMSQFTYQEPRALTRDALEKLVRRMQVQQE